MALIILQKSTFPDIRDSAPKVLWLEGRHTKQKPLLPRIPIYKRTQAELFAKAKALPAFAPAALFSSPQMCYNSLSIRKRGTRMARNRQNLNIITISDRMQETLRPIASCALTAVVVLRATVKKRRRCAGSWQSRPRRGPWCRKPASTRITAPSSGKVQKAFAAARLTVLGGHDCPRRRQRGAALLLEDLYCRAGRQTPTIFFWTISCWGRAGWRSFVSAGLPPA